MTESERLGGIGKERDPVVLYAGIGGLGFRRADFLLQPRCGDYRCRFIDDRREACRKAAIRGRDGKHDTEQQGRKKARSAQAALLWERDRFLPNKGGGQLCRFGG